MRNFAKLTCDRARAAPNVAFLVVGVTAAAAVATTHAGPALDRLGFDVFGWSPLTALGTDSLIGHIKRVVMDTTFATSLALLVVVYLALLGTAGRVARSFAMVALVLVNVGFAALSRYPSQPIDLAEQIQIVNFPLVDYETIFSKKPLLDAGIRTEDEFFRVCKERYVAHREMLKDQWGVEDDEKLRAVFYTNLVCGLWAFGNADHPDRPGCVNNNEDTGFQTIEPTIATYLSSEIACCDDYAYLLKVLLDRDGIENRRVGVSGHVFNEARLNGRWYTLDANINLMFDGTWKSIQNRPGRRRNAVRVTVFPHHNLVASRDRTYRDSLGHFRLQWLLRTMNKSAPPIDYPDG